MSWVLFIQIIIFIVVGLVIWLVAIAAAQVAKSNEPVYTTLHFDELTLTKVYDVLERYNHKTTAVQIVDEMLDKGILFRERTPSK